MKTRELNLARRPFVNARPVQRLTALLWVLGVALLSLNVVLFWQYFSQTDDSQQERAALQQRIKQHRERIAENKVALGAFNLYQQNAQVDFLNRRIAERTFPWSQLFDHLEEVLPNDVRLQNLAPQAEEGRSRNSEEARPGGRVRMAIIGVAKSPEAELEFIDRLFAHPSFERPRLQGDSMQAGGLLKFNIRVTYFPEPQGSSEAVTVEAESETREKTTAAVAESTKEAPEEEPAVSGGSSASGQALGAPPANVAVAAAVPTAAAAELPRETSTPPPVRRSRRNRAPSADEEPPADPTELSRRNRRRSSNGNSSTPEAAAPSAAAPRGGLVLPQGAGRQGTAESPATNRRRNRTTAGRNRGRSPAPGIPLPPGEDEAPGERADPRDPRRPSPRTSPASSTLEVQ